MTADGPAYGRTMEKRTVLFVDDEINILSSLRRGLIDQEFRCVFANSGQEALEILEKQEVHVIVSDMKMPVMDGLKLLKIVREKHPEIVRIVLSGYTQLPQVLATVNQADIFKFITKPWQLEEELIPVIHQAIEYYNAMREREDLRKSLENRNQLYQNVLRATEEKLSSDKKNFEDVKRISGYILNEIGIATANAVGVSEQNRRAVNDIIAYYKNLLTGYLEIAMSSHCKFNLERIIADLQDALAEAIPDFKLKTDNKADLGYYGNYNLFQHIVGGTIKLLACCFEQPKAAVSILSSIEEDYIKLFCIIEVSGKEGGHPQINENVGFQAFFSFVSEVCRCLSGHLDIQSNHSLITVKISTQFKKV